MATLPNGIRAGARRAEVYNSGLHVWLYDEANQDAIVRDGAVATLVAEGEDEAEGALRRLARAGTLVAYALQQDDSLRVDVLVGEPLTAAERKGGRWLAPQQAFIRLPSGRLRVESDDALRLVAGDSPTDEGATIAVPPGDYLLTLHRVDLEALAEAGVEGFDGAHEVITLTAGAVAAPRRNGPWLLPYVPKVRRRRAPAAPPPPALVPTVARPGDLRQVPYFQYAVMSWVLGGTYPEHATYPKVTGTEVVAIFDADLASAGYAPLGDVTCDAPFNGELREFTLRLYAGADRATYAIVWATTGGVQWGVCAPLADGTYRFLSNASTLETVRPATPERPAVHCAGALTRASAQVAALRADVARLGGAAAGAWTPSLDDATRAASIVLGYPLSATSAPGA